MDKKEYAVHASHCCKWHGCKYGDDDCPVVNGEIEQLYLCWDCQEDLENEEYHRHMVARIDEIKKWKEKKKKAQGETNGL